MSKKKEKKENLKQAEVNTKPAKDKKEKKEKSPRERILKKNRHRRNLKWSKFDNTANLFPVITGEGMSNVYRVSATLNEEIQVELLQQALEMILPYFDLFRSCMKRGLFWWYFEDNQRPVPKIHEENTYPCMYINPHENKNYLFRVSYYKNRINLEVFHAVTDGNGGFTFLKELVYQYLRLAHPELKGVVHGMLSADTSLNIEDSYVKNYKHAEKNIYSRRRAIKIKGERLPINQFAIIHGKVDLAGAKEAAKKYGVTINQYLVGVYTWSIYKAYLKSQPTKRVISTVVPVNLRPYFESDTNKNFFAVVSAIFRPDRSDYTLEDVIRITTDSLKEQVTKENLERLLSYNVSNQENPFLRMFPIIIKDFALLQIYNASAKSNCSTLTNLGLLKSEPAYDPYIENFQAVLSMSKGHNMKATVVSYRNTMNISISANFRDTNIQRTFFRQLVQDGAAVSIETNGVYYE